MKNWCKYWWQGGLLVSRWRTPHFIPIPPLNCDQLALYNPFTRLGYWTDFSFGGKLTVFILAYISNSIKTQLPVVKR